ncbi:pyruvate,orthophosphate dikinase [Kineosphaera limosa]|uniref:Pyruvate, phosphate dikinase n=1 Tax=Kineosphaera limosa NBRC 100340 TaxID=1184609 RepID=K6XEV3_9MICO|nr:pyruvate, phosphate dikinase [Kineosphaera limosa]NYE01602.1 pyruvate,orthophosphate dikinase [Kineosphaera limosa]GAB97324.1 pyruvate, phosphate dikinase [Kineosphaera limosa NBRC 100340]
MSAYVYDLSQGNKDLKDLLGGKGANLAEMHNMGIPVPPTFTITTEACREYLTTGSEPASLAAEIDEHVTSLEQAAGKKLGDAQDPLLLSVRSGAKFSMPGMMETVLNIGLNDASVEGLAAQSDNPRFAYDSYRRLLQMFGKTVLDLDGDLFEDVLDEAKLSRGVASDTDLDVNDFKAIVARFKGIIAEQTGRDFPQDPREQLLAAVRAVFNSWNSERAILYRKRENIPAELGTAVNVCTMVFGNLGSKSGTGVAFTRDPASGAQGVYGDYLENAQGEDVVAGIRNTIPLLDLETIDKAAYDELMSIMSTLETHYKDLCDIEFTVQEGKLWMLQTRVGKRTAAAAFVIACQLIDEGIIDEAEALRRVDGDMLAQLMFPRFDPTAPKTKIAKGMNASPGAATGRMVFDSHEAVDLSVNGHKVILVRRETNPDDLGGMIAAQGILTSRGGKTSHAAVVARGMGKTCVCGAEELDIDVKNRTMKLPDGRMMRAGDIVSIDGTTGEVFEGEVPVVAPPVVQYFEGTLSEEEVAADDLVRSVARIMAAADKFRRLGVRANADNAEDSARARRFGASGVGLCRTEHMFLGTRRSLVERLILADTPDGRTAALEALLPLQRGDFIEIFEAMDGLPVTVRLLDPPLHEFLPDITEITARVAVAEKVGGGASEEDKTLLAAVERLHEQNPMLGLRGVRLGLSIKGLFTMQARAICEAAAERIKAGGDPRPEIMVPLVGDYHELQIMKDAIRRVEREVSEETGVDLTQIPVGTMIELPRAALTAGEIAESAEFFSFGTNDLTQTTWGFSRDDVEAEFFSNYLERGIFKVSPFESLDVDGVGRLVKIAAEEGRKARPELHLGVCGEHGGDPASVHFFDKVGLDYVSCSPFRVPVARLEAGRAAVEDASGSDTR